MSTIKYNKKPSKIRTKSEASRLEDIEQVATELDRIARKRLPDGVIKQGVLSGYEAEIRQEALIMAVDGFLQGNTGYQASSAERDEVAISTAMERCMAITLQITKRRMASRLSRSQSKESQLTETNGGTRQHPSQCRPCDWPPDVKANVIMRSVVMAVNQGKLSVSNATIVSMVCERGMGVEDVAETWKVSRSAVYQQIQRVRRVIPDIIDQVDICLM